MSHATLSAEDAAWFEVRPHRQFRCRHLTLAERARDREEMPAAGMTRLAYVRCTDGAIVMVWARNPDFLLAEEDETCARRVAQAMPNPPRLDVPENAIDFDAIAAPVEESIRALADDALARGAITADQHRAIHAEPEAHVLPEIGVVDEDGTGPRLKVGAKINPAFLVEIGLPGRQS
jgi:hypothetical protein